MITQPLAEPTTVSARDDEPAIILHGEKQGAKRLLLWGVIIMFIGVAIGVIGKKLMHEEIVTVVGVLVSLLGMFLTVYQYLSPSPRQKYHSSLSSQPEALTRSQRPKDLPPGNNIEYLPSITERTTDLFEISVATKPGQKMEEENRRPHNSVREES